MIVTGRDIKIVRLRGDKTQKQIADQLGVKSRKTIENWEKGQSEPSHNQFIQMVHFCGLDAAKLTDLLVKRASIDIEINVMEADI